MYQEKYSLTWHNYSDHLRSMMKEWMMNEDFSDVTLVTEDKKQIKANINILTTCSTVFKDILKKEKNSNQILYLRGVQFSEMESIMQFIYLGETTFSVERMDEFLAVAKSLEIKELCNAETETKDELNDEPSSCDPAIPTENLEEPTGSDQILKLCFNDQIKMQAPQERKMRFVNEKHGDEGIKNACDQCDFQATEQRSLTRHIHSKHDGIKYACDLCDYQAIRQESLSHHIQLKHKGIKYHCDLCDKQFTRQDALTTHMHSKHEGTKYLCDQCDYTAPHSSSLKNHIQSKGVTSMFHIYILY